MSIQIPTPVEKLPSQQRIQWASIVEKALFDKKDGETAVKIANAIVKKHYDAFEVEPADDEFVTLAEKDYQYVSSWEYEERKLSQEEAAYNPVGGTSTKACSNCKFFISPARCSVVSGVIAPNGLSNQWRAVTPYVQEPLPVIIVGGKQLKELAEPTLAQKLLGAAKSLVGGKPENPAVKDATGLTIFKQADGRLRWYARYSNAWEDKDKELITQEAHKEYTEWVVSEKMYPELWLWHTPGTRFGEADWVDFSDGFAHASGLIDDTPQAKSVVEYLSSDDAGELGVSHGFFCTQKGKYINKYRTFEISILPQERASAYGTDFNVFGKETEIMAFTPGQKKFLESSLGADGVALLEANSEKSAASLKALGVEFKQAAATEQAAEITTTEGMKELATLMGQTLQAVNSLTEAVTATKTIADQALATAQKSHDEVKSDDYLARVAKAYAGGAPAPSESASNVVSKEEASRVGTPQAVPTGELSGVDFFGGTILKQISGIEIAGAAAAAAGVGAPAVAAVTGPAAS